MRRSVPITLVLGLLAFAALGRPTVATGGRWVAGDLHIHSTYSHDSYGGPTDDNTGPDEFYTLGNTVTGHFAVAASRGLDFLAITDHNDIRSTTDPGFGAFGVIGVPGYEASLSGHAQMLGATEIYDRGTGAPGAQAMADLLRSRGGIFQINHPAGESVDWPNDPDWRYGYQIVPDAVEVWNITPWWQAPAPASNDTEGAIDFWEGWLDRGEQVAVTGGADNHWLYTTPAQGAGQPTTWVWVSDDSAQAVLDGIRAGRTFVSGQPPLHQGTTVRLDADPAEDLSFGAMMGDTVPAGTAVRVSGENAPPGAVVRVVWSDLSERRSIDIPVTTPTFTSTFRAPLGARWIRAEVMVPDGRDERRAACDDAFGDQTTLCRNRIALLALSSAIYVAP